MATSVTLNGTGTTYSIPSQGQSPPWGQDLSDFLNGVTSVLNSLSGSADILLTTFSITNNQASAATVTGCAFNPATVRSAIISYSIYRSTNSTELSECGQIYITYKSTAATWELAQNYVGSSGVTFTITTGGQIQYASSSVSGSSYSGTMKFYARSFLQT